MIRSRDDIATALRASAENGGLQIEEADLGAEFFDVKSGLAREVVRRFTSYRARVALVVGDLSSHGAEFAELAHEHRAHAMVRFFGSTQQARQWLAQLPNKRC